MSDAFDGALDDYIQHLRVERGLSRHTVDGYASDLGKFGRWLTDEGTVLGKVDESIVAGAMSGGDDRHTARRRVVGGPAAGSVRGRPSR